MPRKKGQYETPITKTMGQMPGSIRNTPEWEPELISISEDLEWTPEQWALIAWDASPLMERDPITQQGLADQLGVTTRTLQNWRKLPYFRAQVRAIAKKYLEKHLPNIYYALADQASRGSFPHIKLALELMGEYVERYDYTSGGKPFPIQTFDFGAAIAPLTAGSTSDSPPSE